MGFSSLFSLLVLMAAGCKSYSIMHYISPRVTGQVVDARTQEPIKDVKVERVLPKPTQTGDSTTKGAVKMENQRGVYTKADGTFELDSRRDIEIIASVGWYSVTIKFTREGYSQCLTNYFLTNAVHLPSGEPFVHAGKIALTPKPK
jgi:hypothetical protein